MKTKNIVFITGAFIHHSCWDHLKTYFESEDFTCVAPPWKYKDAPNAADLRRKHPDKNAALALLTLKELIDYYANICQSQPEKPIIIGHSLGGLITQILVNRGLGAAGVAIHSAPPQGIIPYEFSFFKSSWRSFGFFTSTKKTYLMSFKKWQYAVTDEMSLREQKASYEKYAIPESKTVQRGVMTSAAAIDFSKPHVPLLLISGSIDKIIPAAINLRNFKKYKESGSILEYKEFENRNHFALEQPTWKADADYVLEWLQAF